MWLAIDTSGPVCAAALASGEGRIVAERSEEIGRGHAERLMPMIGELMAARGADWGDLTALAVTTGPGSFTGLRVGLSAARGLALALGIPVHGVSVFDAYAVGCRAHLPFTVALDARRGEVWAQSFDADGNSTYGPAVLSLDAVAGHFTADMRAIGSAIPLLEEHGGAITALDSPVAPPLAGIIAAAQAQKQPHPASPLYLRAPDAKPQVTA